MKLGKNVFVALAAVAWADGKETPDETEALLHAARDCGVDDAGLDEVKRVTLEKATIDGIRKLAMTPRERVYVYAIATWLARIDGVVMPEEREMLARLGDILRLADGDRTRASAASFAVSQLEGGDKPSRFDIAKLAARIEQVMAPTLPPPAPGEA
jgi:hypothetical protein